MLNNTSNSGCDRILVYTKIFDQLTPHVNELIIQFINRLPSTVSVNIAINIHGITVSIYIEQGSFCGEDEIIYIVEQLVASHIAKIEHERTKRIDDVKIAINWVTQNPPLNNESFSQYHNRFYFSVNIRNCVDFNRLAGIAEKIHGVEYTNIKGRVCRFIVTDIVRNNNVQQPINQPRQQINTQQSGYVYFIAEEPFSNRVKIGMSVDPHDRVRQLQTGNPNLLVLRHATKYFEYKDLEKTMHEICKDLRVLGEWFEITESELNGLVSAW